MNDATIRKMYVLALGIMIALPVPSAFAQRSKQPAQKSNQQIQQPNAQTQAAPLQTQAAPAQNSLCANQTVCYESSDFVASITQFRTSVDAYGNHVIDAMMHFQNKTNQPISLGYVEGSGSAIDDLGNRLALNSYNGGVRGMGIVNGNNMDPKFSLPAGGGGDARFELYWAPRGKVTGVNYEMELSIREMNRVEGNQWVLGDENLIHYQGLANGMGVAPVSGGNSVGINASGMGGGSSFGTPVGSSVGSTAGSSVNGFVPGQVSTSGASAQPMYTASGQPCPPGSRTAGTLTNVANTAGAQNQQANNAISNASSAISSFSSIFGKKKTAANAPNAAQPNAAGVAPCAPAANPNVRTNAVVPQQTVVGANPAAPAANTKAAAVGRTPVVATQRTSTVTPRTSATQAAPSAGVVKTSLKQPAPVATKPAAAPAKKPAATPATTQNGGGAM